MDPLLAKAEPINDAGDAFLIAYLRVKKGCATIPVREE